MNKIEKNLWIVDYYNEENEKDWMPIIAIDAYEAIREAINEYADLIGVTPLEVESVFKDAEAFIMTAHNNYKIRVSK